ncbi:Tetratricopeptide repeat (TPR)-like superfamily protein [Euphorbia peplus]|nr:Tetratricopeptide repeat (TPR)-like superfamily protein [Euphorbia peplus]
MNLARTLIRAFEARNGSHSIFYSSKATPLSNHRSVRPSKASMSELYRRISPIQDSKISVLPILDQWVEEGRSVDQTRLRKIIKDLGLRCKRYRHALEISIWMSIKYSNLTSDDIAIRLDFIAKSLGVEQVEKYFSKVPQQLKDLQVYGALLNCYATVDCVEKSEAVSRKMTDLGFAKRTLEYNAMLRLYYKTGNVEKFNALLQEMEENGVVHNEDTLTLLLHAYAAGANIEGIDKVVRMMESGSIVCTNWVSRYLKAATGYRQAGLLDKSVEMLKKAEEQIATKGAMYNLMIVYATIGRKDEVLRIWSLCKKKYCVDKIGYASMVTSLVKIGDFDMAEKTFDELDSLDQTYSIEILNSIIRAYCKNGLFDKAEALIDRARSKGVQPDDATRYCFVMGYFEFNQPEKAVEMMKGAIVLTEPFRRHHTKYFAACLNYLKGLGDIEEAEEFIKLMSDKKIIALDIEEKLLNAIRAKESDQIGTMLQLMLLEEK